METDFSDYNEEALNKAKMVIKNRGGVEKRKKVVQEREKIEQQKEIEVMIKEEEKLRQMEEAEEKKILETHIRDIKSKNIESDNRNGSNIQKYSLIIIGIILVIAAVIAVIAAQPMLQQSGYVYMFKDMAKGNQMRLTASIIIFGGYGAGAIGLILLLVGLLKKN